MLILAIKYLTAKQKSLISALLLLTLFVLIVPHKAIGQETSPSLEFPTHTAQKASILYFGKNECTEYKSPRWATYIIVTSYNSVPEQTDSTPFITASGTTTRDGVVASNYLPIGTEVRFPDLYGDKVFIVEDRMNSRYYKRADIWSEDMQFSKDFGARYLRMEIL